MYRVLCDGEPIQDFRSDDLVLIDPKLTLEANTAGSFQFKVPPKHPKYNDIKKFQSIIQVYHDGDEIFRGRALSDKCDFYNRKQVVCEGQLAFLNDSIQRPAEYHDMTVRGYLEKLIEIHNSQVDETRQFTVGIVTVTDNNDSLYRYTNYNNTMTEIKEDLIDDLGGYLRIRNTDGKHYIDYIAEFDHTCEQSIEFGENLLDFSRNVDMTDIATAVIPLGSAMEEGGITALNERVNIKSVNDGLDYVVNAEAVKRFGFIIKTKTWDGVSKPEILKRRGEKWLQENQFEDMVLDVSAVDLHCTDDQIEQFRLYDMIPVHSAPHGLKAHFPLTKMTLNLNSPSSDKFTLGTALKTSLTAKSSEISTQLKNASDRIPATENILNQAIQNATELINNATHGHVVTTADEVLIMDTNNIDTAKRVWRWNLNGFGYSSTGYKGTYTSAITMDGWILGERIASKSLTAEKIKAGTITSAEIAADTIKSTNIAASAITSSELATNSVTTDKIEAGAVTAKEIASNTITAEQIAANAITAAELAAKAVTTDKIESGAITTEKIAADAVTADKIKAGTITAEEIAANTITSAEIAAKAITATELAANSVTTEKIAVGAVTANEIAAGTITTSELSAGAVTTTNLAANAVTAAKIDVADLFAQNIKASGSIEGVTLKGATGEFSGNITAKSALIYDHVDIYESVYDRTITALTTAFDPEDTYVILGCEGGGKVGIKGSMFYVHSNTVMDEGLDVMGYTNFYDNVTVSNSAITIKGGGLYASGDVKSHGWVSKDWGGNIYCSDNVYVRTDWSFYAPTIHYNTMQKVSDERCKDIIGGIDDRYEGAFMKLQPITYYLKSEENGKPTLGLGAQTTERILKDYGIMENDSNIVQHTFFDVEVDGMKDRYTIDYQEVGMLTMWMTQKNTRNLAKLEEKLAELEARIPA